MPNDLLRYLRLDDDLDGCYSCHRLSGGHIAVIWDFQPKGADRITIGWRGRHDRLISPREARLAFMDEPTEIACHAILTTIHSEGEP